MTVHPFIEAEKQSGHSVQRACELLKVSRTAFYALRQLGNRLVGILHGCLKTRTLYDEATAWSHHAHTPAT
ncbi:hypothetical protein ACH4TV_12900 [Streptomyces sp. NPDC020898]|uniref:hypothetical protein n=1 Tax=Streptomyces sp. NPDC020898 TaxID=3365101 RepID=UPI0037B1158A